MAKIHQGDHIFKVGDSVMMRINANGVQMAGGVDDDELELLDNALATVSWGVAAGASNVCIFTGTVKDAAGATIEAVHNLLVYISEAATGAGVSADSYSTGAAVSTGVSLGALTANKVFMVQTNTSGVFAISITASAKPADQYCVAVHPLTGRPIVSAASAALWGA
jgi:hypothetical protein